MEQPKISIIIPVYNGEVYLEDCVKSILGQNFRDFEILLVDDGSTDSTWDICRRLAAADNRIKPIHKQNGGVSSARNAGIEAASGCTSLASAAFPCVPWDWCSRGWGWRFPALI